MTALDVLFLLQLVASGGLACDDAELTMMLRAQEHLARGDDTTALATLAPESGACAQRQLAALALRGWSEARALAAGGGAVDLQGPVRQTLDELRGLAADPALALDAEYAETCIRAGIAAAQDERPEMELLLTHARDLSQRLMARERRALWPRSFNIVAGELWFEVDRFAEAIAAYDRAARADASAAALVGLARSLARIDRIEDACAAYRRTSDVAPALRAAAAADLMRCR